MSNCNPGSKENELDLKDPISSTSNSTLRKTVSFTKSDLDRIEELKVALEASNNAQTLSMAIKLAADIVKQQQKGGKIIFDDNGKQREMMIAGVTKNE